MLACSVLLLTACDPVGDGDNSEMLDPTLARTLVGGQEVPGPAPYPRGLPAQERAAGGDRVDVVDPATVRIRLSQPFAPLAAVLVRSLPDMWSHEAEPEPTPDYHQAADAYMAAARADLGAPD